MPTITRFEDLEIWIKSRQLSLKINLLVKSGMFKNEFGLINQLKNSSGSIVDNIAEGFERDDKKSSYNLISIDTK